MAAAVAVALSGQAYAADLPVEPGPNFEKVKAEQLKRLEQRLVHLQEEKNCIQAAANYEAVKACREKFKGDMKADRQMMKR
jgi:hypothetical protein